MAKSSAKDTLFRQVGQQIARVRARSGMTQVQLARELGVSQSMIAAYETGKKCISIARLVLLVRILDTSADEILKTDDKKLHALLTHELIPGKA